MDIGETRDIQAHSAHADLGRRVGAVVIGGDYQGLGIVRSLGGRGIPVCVVDDEQSVSKFSRYCTYFVKVPNLRDGLTTVSGLLEMGERMKLHGWVLYPTRDEHVAAFSRSRSELSKVFRVPTPSWESVKWAWDKRNTYCLAQKLGIPTPRTHWFEHIEQLSHLDQCDPPFAIKPAIKEHFIYATKAKAWCAKSHAELKVMFDRASRLIGAGEVMVQEVIPPMWRLFNVPSWRNCRSASCVPLIITVWLSLNTSSIPEIPSTKCLT
jgi:D-aspartate ligase